MQKDDVRSWPGVGESLLLKTRTHEYVREREILREKVRERRGERRGKERVRERDVRVLSIIDTVNRPEG